MYLLLKGLGYLIALTSPVIAFFFEPMKPVVVTFLVTLAGICEAAPDAVGDLQPEYNNEPKRWDWYVDAHWGGAINAWMKQHWYLFFTLFWLSHTWEDRFFHTAENGGKWFPGKLWLEVAIWLAMGLIIWRLI